MSELPLLRNSGQSGGFGASVLGSNFDVVSARESKSVYYRMMHQEATGKVLGNDEEGKRRRIYRVPRQLTT